VFGGGSEVFVVGIDDFKAIVAGAGEVEGIGGTERAILRENEEVALMPRRISGVIICHA